MLLEKPPPAFVEPPTPFLRLTIMARMLLMFFKFCTSACRAGSLSGRTKTAIVLSLSLMLSILRLGRRNCCRSKNLPCGVRARWWNSPYTESPSFSPELALVGPLLCECGCDSAPMICNEWSVSALMNIVSRRLNISSVVIRNMRYAERSPGRYAAARRR